MATQDMPTSPSAAARDFCPAAEDDPEDKPITLAPATPEAGWVPVREISNPYFPDFASGKLVMTSVTLPPRTCILGSYFYPSMVMTVTLGNISIFVEHLPGVGAAPEAFITSGGNTDRVLITIGEEQSVAPGDWVTITNESLVGFRNETNDVATFYVAGIKMDDPERSGGHKGRLP